MSKELLHFILNLDYQEAKIIKKTPMFYIVRFFFKDGLFYTSKLKKKDIENGIFSNNIKLMQLFNNEVI